MISSGECRELARERLGAFWIELKIGLVRRGHKVVCDQILTFFSFILDASIQQQRLGGSRWIAVQEAHAFNRRTWLNKLSPATTSLHLRILRELGFVAHRRGWVAVKKRPDESVGEPPTNSIQPRVSKEERDARRMARLERRSKLQADGYRTPKRAREHWKTMGRSNGGRFKPLPGGAP